VCTKTISKEERKRQLKKKKREKGGKKRATGAASFIPGGMLPVRFIVNGVPLVAARSATVMPGDQIWVSKETRKDAEV
jgi:hypothetical protein